MNTHYVIVGASHAALSALHTLRMSDADHEVTLISRERELPYSPTVLPYVVSGRSDPSRVALRDARYFDSLRVNVAGGHAVARVDPDRRVVVTDDGAEIGYAKLLIATGATPALPPVPGLRELPFHVLRTMEDAVGLRAALPKARAAVVLGAGLIGMHAAENLAKAGVRVTVAEMQPQVLPGYFDAEAAQLIEQAFDAAGVRVITGARVERAAAQGEGFVLGLASGAELEGDLLIVATGVAPVVEPARAGGIEIDRGILVDELMRTSAPDVWAAGDCAQARSFYGSERVLNGILPDAVEQGRVAGLAMAGDPAVKPYRGGVPLNTYSFFGHQALAVGVQAVPGRECETLTRSDPARGRHLKVVLDENRLAGIFGIDEPFDPGIMLELILRRIDLAPVRERFLARPQDTARVLMSRTWR